MELEAVNSLKKNKRKVLKITNKSQKRLLKDLWRNDFQQCQSIFQMIENSSELIKKIQNKLQ